MFVRRSPSQVEPPAPAAGSASPCVGWTPLGAEIALGITYVIRCGLSSGKNQRAREVTCRFATSPGRSFGYLKTAKVKQVRLLRDEPLLRRLELGVVQSA